MITLSAILDSIIGFYQVNIRPVLTWKLLGVTVLFVAVAVSTALFVSSSRDESYRQREEQREIERQVIEQESDFLRKAANKATVEAARLERENRELKDQAKELRRAVEKISEQRRNSKIIYVQKQKQLSIDLEKVTDADALRVRNCERRRALGYPCPDK
jgi:hypothetical protein